MKIYNIDLTLDRLDNFNNKIFGVKDIDHENIKLINEYFAKDFQLFSYDKISISAASDAWLKCGLPIWRSCDKRDLKIPQWGGCRIEITCEFQLREPRRG